MAAAKLLSRRLAIAMLCTFVAILLPYPLAQATNFTFATAITISQNSFISVNINQSNQKRYYAFTPSTTGFYTIESSANGTSDPYGWLFNSAQTELTQDNDGAGSGNFRIGYHLDSGQKYYIVAGCSSTGTGNYDVRVTATTNMASIAASLPTSTLYTSQSSTMAYIAVDRQRKYFVFTATTAGTYVFQSLSNDSSDPMGYLYNDSAALILSNDNGAGNQNYKITANLSAGQTVYLVAGCNGAYIGTFRTNVRNRYVASVQNRFDNGYVVNYYGSVNTTNTSSAANAINGYMYSVATRYSELLGLQITNSGAVYYPSAIDLCKYVVTATNLNDLCPYANPHTTLFNRNGSNNPNVIHTHFTTYITPVGSNTLTNAYWSGHKIKTYDDLLDEFNRSYSCGFSVYVVEKSSTSNRTKDSQGTLMHELNHQYGVPDHYHEPHPSGGCYRQVSYGGSGYCTSATCNTANGTFYRPPTCIMNDSRQDITLTTILCAGCESNALAHLNSHHK